MFENSPSLLLPLCLEVYAMHSPCSSMQWTSELLPLTKGSVHDIFTSYSSPLVQFFIGTFSVFENPPPPPSTMAKECATYSPRVLNAMDMKTLLTKGSLHEIFTSFNSKVSSLEAFPCLRTPCSLLPQCSEEYSKYSSMPPQCDPRLEQISNWHNVTKHPS